MEHIGSHLALLPHREFIALLGREVKTNNFEVCRRGGGEGGSLDNILDYVDYWVVQNI